MPEAAPSPLVVLSRPQGRNEELIERLQHHGLAALSLPALEIHPLPEALAALPLPADHDLLVFVSANAARLYIAALQGCPGAAWPAGTLAATVGAASARPLLESGFVPASCVLHPGADQSQDSEALWALLQASGRRFRNVLIVRGETGREWLGSQFERAGAKVRRYAVYGRRPAAWSARQYARLSSELAEGGTCIALFTSAEGVEAYWRKLADAQWQPFWQGSRFVVIHERVAARLQSLLARVRPESPTPAIKVCRPTGEAIFQAIIAYASP